ncbi:histone-lysine N-methyltransferase SETMAR [Elysia marginata]|uniref:Histone-lysine N-methyltransferase SETMAR n=1 Tax=Elysia marginata TaxID=1093978 RepID=A0AAV4JYH6_9GAST|nr:histone-lysine N-methyltransferase SETMAR [Elysia marginata]
MATPFKDWSKLEVTDVVRFLFSKGTRPSEIHKQITETYGEGAMSISRVYQWCTWFEEGRTSLDCEPKSGRPKTPTNEENTTFVDELIKCDRRIIRETFCHRTSVSMLSNTATLLTFSDMQFVARPGLLRRGIVLQHDNATPHSANLTQQWLQRYGWEILPLPTHNPNIAASDFHLSGPLKRHLGGIAF